MRRLRDDVLDALEAALSGVDGAPDREALSKALSTPPDPALGDLAFPCFPLAKALRKAPPAIAAELAARIEPRGLLAEARPAGPYLNFVADAGARLAALLGALADGTYDASLHAPEPVRTMVEFSQPNTHKVFHVGHFRNVALGDSLQRALRARGHDVVAANYYGDFGIDVAKCLWWLEHRDVGEPPATGRGAWLGAAYANTTAELARLEAEDPEARKRVQAELKDVLGRITAGEEPWATRYRETRQWCLDEFADIYDWLDVHFDAEFYESELEEAGHAIVDEYLERGVFEPSEGAIVCMLDDYDLGPALVRKSDGTSLYLTWDLVLARKKFDDFDVERSLYVVGSEQTYHFEQLFATLERMGYDRAKDCRHVAYELVMLPEGKMSSRKGKVVPFLEIRDAVRDAVRAKMQADESSSRANWSPEQWDATADRVAAACLRYGMLRVSNTTRVIFDLDAWTALDGESGAYLLYSLARVSGIFRRAGAPDVAALTAAARDCEVFGAPAERALLGHLLRYDDVLAVVERDLDVSPLTTWLYEGAKAWSRFYHDCPVLKAEEPLRSARLGLARATEAVVGRGLRTIGVEPLQEM